jgi:CRP-like cAMP-binding protein
MELNNSPPNIGPVPRSAIVPIFDRDTWSRAVAADRKLSSRDRLVALLLFLADDEGDLTYEQIAATTGCGRRTAMRAVLSLIERGWIKVEVSSTGGKPNRFRMAMREVAS